MQLIHVVKAVHLNLVSKNKIITLVFKPLLSTLDLPTPPPTSSSQP